MPAWELLRSGCLCPPRLICWHLGDDLVISTEPLEMGPGVLNHLLHRSTQEKGTLTNQKSAFTISQIRRHLGLLRLNPWNCRKQISCVLKLYPMCSLICLKSEMCPHIDGGWIANLRDFRRWTYERKIPDISFLLASWPPPGELLSFFFKCLFFKN